VLPLVTRAPVVLLLPGWLLLGERPTLPALAGVLLLVLGALELGRSGRGAGLLHAPGARSMLLVAVLWGIGASIDKLGVQAGGTLTWVAGFNVVVGLPLLLPALAAGEAHGGSDAVGRPGWNGWPWLLLIALLGTLSMGLQMEALRRTAVVHVIAIKRLSTLFSAVVGVVWLGEYGGSLRLPAAALMLAGAWLVLRFSRG
jgi:drug/metabolite transporter (DMT)-like permease